MSQRHAKAPTQRQLRVGEELRHVVAQCLERDLLRDPDVAGRSITVTEVRVSPDLRNATAFVMPLGGDSAPTVVEGLNRASAVFRRAIARQARLRNVPRLVFALDATFDTADHIDALLRKPDVKRDIEQPMDPETSDGT